MFAVEVSVPQVDSFGVLVLLNSAKIHSIHCVANVAPDSGVYEKILIRGLTRTVYVKANSVREALGKAFRLGVLDV
jgi:hypothetical protein